LIEKNNSNEQTIPQFDLTSKMLLEKNALSFAFCSEEFLSISEKELIKK